MLTKRTASSFAQSSDRHINNILYMSSSSNDPLATLLPHDMGMPVELAAQEHQRSLHVLLVRHPISDVIAHPEDHLLKDTEVALEVRLIDLRNHSMFPTSPTCGFSCPR